VASSICLRATIFQNPEGTLWTHCTISLERENIEIGTQRRKIIFDYIAAAILYLVFRGSSSTLVTAHNGNFPGNLPNCDPILEDYISRTSIRAG
jgi:hypothetical protein